MRLRHCACLNLLGWGMPITNPVYLLKPGDLQMGWGIFLVKEHWVIIGQGLHLVVITLGVLDSHLVLMIHWLKKAMNRLMGCPFVVFVEIDILERVLSIGLNSS